MLTEENLKNRKNGIGASEAATVMGLNPDKSPYQLWLEKTGRAEPTDISNIPIVYFGNVHEPTTLKEYAKKKKCKVRIVSKTLFHKKYPFMLCHLDGKVVGESKVLECKFAPHPNDNWGPDGTDIVPLKYIVQVQHQMAVTGYKEADIAVLISGWDLRVYPFKRDEILIKKIIEEITAFWKCVETDTPPPLRDWNDAKVAYPYSNANIIEAGPEMIEVVEKYKEIRSKMNVLEKEKNKLRDILTLFMKDAEGIRVSDQVIATWKGKDGKRRLNVLETKE